MSTSEESTAIDAVALRLPAFWPADPSLWFAQVEGQFRIRHITSEATKYGNVLSNLPPDTASEVRDLIITPPADEPYTVLNNVVISRTFGTKPQRMKQLLTTEELGDRKPTQFLRRMEHLMDGYNIDQQPCSRKFSCRDFRRRCALYWLQHQKVYRCLTKLHWPIELWKPLVTSTSTRLKRAARMTPPHFDKRSLSSRIYF
ncbi:Uncharacterised protein r2_g44 [Pycnogonum litorale]